MKTISKGVLLNNLQRFCSSNNELVGGARWIYEGIERWQCFSERACVLRESGKCDVDVGIRAPPTTAETNGKSCTPWVDTFHIDTSFLAPFISKRGFRQSALSQDDEGSLGFDFSFLDS